MAHENATPSYPDERAPLSCRLIGPVNIGDAATIDAVEAENDNLRAENKRLRAALFEELDHIRDDVRWADGGKQLERAMAREEAVEAALSEVQP